MATWDPQTGQVTTTPVYDTPRFFDPQLPHASTPHQGDRISVVAYTHHSSVTVHPADVQLLRRLGFPFPRPQVYQAPPVDPAVARTYTLAARAAYGRWLLAAAQRSHEHDAKPAVQVTQIHWSCMPDTLSQHPVVTGAGLTIYIAHQIRGYLGRDPSLRSDLYLHCALRATRTRTRMLTQPQILTEHASTP